MPEYIRKNRVRAEKIESIEGNVLTISDDLEIAVTHEWITHNNPVAGGYYVKPPIGPAIFMTAAEFEDEYEQHVSPAPAKKKRKVAKKD